MPPKVSINIVCYNQEKYIAECIESILNQTYTNIEILVSDDASTDHTVDIAKEYQRKHPGKIVILESPQNQGVHANATKGLKAATGDYYCSFAGDDLMLPEKISEQVKALESDLSATMCHCDALLFDDGTSKDIGKHSDNVAFKSTSFDEILKHNFVCAPSSMVRRSYLPNRYEQKAGSVCDWLYFMEILSKGDGVYIPKILMKYRRHVNSLSSARHLTQMHQDALACLEMAQKKLNIRNKNIFKGYMWILRARAYQHFKNYDFINSFRDTLSYIKYMIRHYIIQ